MEVELYIGLHSKSLQTQSLPLYCYNRFLAAFERCKTKYSDRNQNVDLSYEWLFEFFHDRKPGKEDSWGLSFPQLEKFLKQYQLSCTIIGIDNKVLHQYQTKKFNRNVSPSSVYLLAHNQHIYKLSGDPRQLSQIAGRGGPLGINTTTNAPRSFKLEKLGKLAHYDFINNTENFKEFIKTSLTKKPAKYKLAANDVETVLFNLVRDEKYEPTVILDEKNTVKSISVKTTNDDISSNSSRDYIFTLSNFNSVGEMATEGIDSAVMYKNFTRAQKHFSMAIMNRQTISNYSENVTQLIQSIHASPAYGTFDNSSTPNIQFVRAY